MKIIYCLGFTLLVFALDAQIANFGFENWSMRDSTLQPDGWRTNNTKDLVYAKRVDSLVNQGQYSLYLSNEPPGFESKPGSIHTFFKVDNLVDSLVVRMNIPKPSNQPAGGLFIRINPYGAAQNDWVNQSITDTSTNGYESLKIPFNFSAKPDSVKLEIIVGCGCMRPIPGVFIDQVYLKSSGLSLLPSSIKTVCVFPNPTQKYLNLQKEFSRNARITCYNVAGQRFRLERLASNRLDVSGLPKGVYFLEIEEEGKRSTTKFIKE